VASGEWLVVRNIMVKSYKDLIVWQKAMDLVMLVYQATKGFPKDELYGLTNQIRRAAVSIASNIAEGQARNSSAEFLHFLSIAKGSLAQVETQLLIAQRLDYMDDDLLTEILSVQIEVNKMINGLMGKITERK
jgi:four helix bundle protein